MAKPILAKNKYLRRFHMLPEEKKQGKQRKKGRKTEYGARLEEKQKLKFIYRIMEKQFKIYISVAMKSTENPEEVLIEQLERRLDNVVYRLGFASSIPQARQLVNHGLIIVDGRKVDIPSYAIKSGQTIAIKEKMFTNPLVQEIIKKSEVPPWLSREKNTGKILRLPKREEVPVPVNLKQVLELYT